MAIASPKHKKKTQNGKSNKLLPANCRKSKNNHKKAINNKSENSKNKTLKVVKLPIARLATKTGKLKMDNHKLYKLTPDIDDSLKTKKTKKIQQCMCMDYKVMDAKSGLMDKDIEIKRCKKPAEPGTSFCKKHATCPNMFKNYMTGAEPPVDDEKWNKKYVQHSHNCYAYFLDDKTDSRTDKCKTICKKKKKNDKDCPEKDDDCRPLIPQPGDFHSLQSTTGIKNDETNCSNLTKKIISDNPEIKPALFTEKCPANYYKGAVVVSPEKSFHFYRQNKDGKWSHKPGVLPISHTDASNKEIWVPHFADRNYLDNPLYNTTYSQFCSYYCIPNNNHISTNSA